METWILPTLLGLGLAASCGLRTFLPLLMLAVAARLELFGIALNEQVAWLGSTGAVAALAVATAVELAADKIPAVDHFLSLVGTVSRPAAGALAAGAVFSHADPATAVLAGLIVGAPTALAFHTAQTGTRLVSSATTAGLANPLVSFAEDVLAFVTVVVAFVAPVLIPLVLAALLFVLWRLVGAVRRRTRPPAGASTA